MIKFQKGDFNFYKRPLKKEITLFSTGFNALDKVLGGGFRYPSFIELFGWEDVGKTQLAIRIADYFFKQHKFLVIFCDFDSSLYLPFLEQKKFEFLLFPMSAITEERIAHIINIDVPELIIIDSIVNFNLSKKLLHLLKRKLIIFVNQRRFNPDKLVPTVYQWGSLFFLADTRLEIKRKSYKQNILDCEILVNKHFLGEYIGKSCGIQILF